MDDECAPLSEGEEPIQQVAWDQLLPRRQTPATVLTAIENRLKQRERYFSLPHTQQELIASLRNEQWEIRSAAVEILSATGELDVVPFLLDTLHDENRFVRMSTVRALGKRKEEICVNLLLTAAQDHDWQVREIVMLTLGELGNSRAEETIEAGVHDPNNTVREAAHQALQQLHRREKNLANAPMLGIVLSGEEPQNSSQERRPSLTAKSPQTLLAPQDTPQHIPEQVIRRFHRGRLSLLIAAALAFALMGAGIVHWVWNPQFGSPDLYQTINQQQMSMGVTITVTRVYADEGRTVIAYDISAPGTNKNFLAGAYTLTSPTPQKQEALFATECDAPQDGITHCYLVQPAFLVPAETNTLSLTWEVKQLIESGTPNTISGSWQFSFTVPFHHENRQDIPDPIHGETYLP